MDKHIKCFDSDDISAPIKNLLDEFSKKCVNALLENITTNIGMLQNKNDELISTNNALREKISEYEKQSESNTVYHAFNNTITKYQVASIVIYRYSQRIIVLGRSQYFELSDFGKTVFLTKEKAEQALRKENEGK